MDRLAVLMKVHESWYTHPLVLGNASGILLAIGYRFPGAWPLLFIALVPLLYAVRVSRSAREAFYAGTIAGLWLMGTATTWLFSVVPLPTNYGVSTAVAGLALVTLSWILASVATGVVVGLWAVLLRFLNLKQVMDVVTVALLWEGGEALRMLSFNVLTYNPVIHNPLFFSAGFLGYPIMDTESLRQLAAFGGVYTIGFLVVLVNTLLFYFATSSNRTFRARGVSITLLALLVVSLLPFSHFRMMLATKPTQTVRVAIMSLYLPPSLDESAATSSITSQEKDFITEASTQNPEIILLPEDSKLFYPFTPDTVGEYLVPQSQALVTDSGGVTTVNRNHPLRLYADTRESQVGIRDKQVLTPQGEYLPSLFGTALSLAGLQKEAVSFIHARGYSSSNPGSVQLHTASARAAILFCLEVMSPGLGRSLVTEQSDNLLLVPASHLLFKSSPVLEQDTFRFARSQAVEAGVPLASSVLQGSAYVIDRYGNVLATAGKKGGSDVTVVTIPVVMSATSPSTSAE
jgi:apolipoprotein N-acyltransferase